MVCPENGRLKPVFHTYVFINKPMYSYSRVDNFGEVIFREIQFSNDHKSKFVFGKLMFGEGREIRKIQFAIFKFPRNPSFHVQLGVGEIQFSNDPHIQNRFTRL